MKPRTILRKPVIKESTDYSKEIKEIYETEILTKEISLKKRIEFFSSLPYTEPPFNKRSWGYNLHTLLSYQSKLKASIAYHLVQTFTESGQKILDPFSGVGTIPFEACLNGRSGYGLDINPAAFHTTLAKVQVPKQEQVLKIIKDLKKFLDVPNQKYNDVDSFTKRFYHPDTLKEILISREFFLKRINQKKNPAFSFVLAAMLHILHGNRPYALSRRSHNLTPLAPRGPTIYKPVISSLVHKITLSYKNLLPERYLKGDAAMGTVFDMPYKENYFDSILTSPPFLNSTRFYANNRIRLWFCGWDYHTQEKKGRTHFLDELQKEDLSIYKDVFKEFKRVLKINGLCIMHLGVINNFDVGKKISPFAEQTGFKIIDIVYENIKGMEKHGMKDQGVTNMHQFLILKKN